jgi:Fic family protein
MKPPYDITSRILQLISSISEKIGETNSAHLYRPRTELRKRNRIRTIQSSLEIEGNTLSEEQITDLLDNKRVLAPQKDILEVKNAINVYNKLDQYVAHDVESLCEAHQTLMSGLISDNGQLRRKSVGIVKGVKVAHVAPPGDMVPQLVRDLLNYIKNDEDLTLIKSCVFHYEFEFIHPFSDGNGRMGRLWQTIILKKYSPIFEYLPIESLIKDKQKDYYDVLGKADKAGKSTIFIEFMLSIIELALEDILKTQSVTLTSRDRITLFEEHIGAGYFTRQDYLRRYKDISAATASRDLKEAVDHNVVEKTGDKRTAKYKYKETKPSRVDGSSTKK